MEYICIAGLSVLYSMFLLAVLFQNYNDVKEIIYFLYPDLRQWQPDEKVGEELCFISTSDYVKATSWSTNDDITDAHISATIQQILTKFAAVVSYVKQRQIGKFQLICTWVTMLTKYIILQHGGKSRSKNKNKFCLIYLCICW